MDCAFFEQIVKGLPNNQEIKFSSEFLKKLEEFANLLQKTKNDKDFIKYIERGKIDEAIRRLFAKTDSGEKLIKSQMEKIEEISKSESMKHQEERSKMTKQEIERKAIEKRKEEMKQIKEGENVNKEQYKKKE